MQSGGSGSQEEQGKQAGAYREAKFKLGRSILSHEGHEQQFIRGSKHGGSSVTENIEHVEPSQILFLSQHHPMSLFIFGRRNVPIVLR